MSENDHAYIAGEIDQNLKLRFRTQWWWSLANFGATSLIVIFSSTAAVLTQLKVKESGGVLTSELALNIATVLSLAVTIISTIQSKLGFERKWVASRMTRSALEQLQIDEKTGTELPKLVTTLKAIIAKHDEAITGTSSNG